MLYFYVEQQYEYPPLLLELLIKSESWKLDLREGHSYLHCYELAVGASNIGSMSGWVGVSPAPEEIARYAY